MERRPRSFYVLTAFFALFVLFLYGPTITIGILSFQGPARRCTGSRNSSNSRRWATSGGPSAAR